eukprot:13901899-Alexandrium_andersonii.AAC.1
MAGPEDSEADSWLPVGWQVLAGVPGHYMKSSMLNPEAHATALVLGRVYASCTVENISDRTCQKMLAMLYASGVNVGQKHHSRNA